jgi:GTP-binding protein Era
VEELEREDDLTRVHATLVVERDSQKGIVIGKGGATLKAIGTAARAEMEQLLGTRVFLDLRVKVMKEWQRDPKAMNRLGL